jgi:hypothetical protein
VLRQKADFGHNEVDITGLSAGLYIVKLLTSSGQFSQKIIIK